MQLGQIAGAQNTRPQSGLPRNTKANPKQVNAVITRSGLQLKKEVPEQVSPTATDDDPKANVEKGVKEKAAGDEIQMEKKTIPLPFPQRKMKHQEEDSYKKFLDLLKQVHVNLPLIDILQSVLKYAKYLKDIVANKNQLTEYAIVALIEEFTSKIQNKLPIKLKDLGSFTL